MKISNQKPLRRLSLVALLLSAGWVAWAFFVVGVMLTVAAAAGAFIFYVNAKAEETTAVIGNLTNTLPKFILHHRYDVGKPDAQGLTEVILPPGAESSFAQWRIDRSTNFIDWTPSTSLYTDQESADMLARILFATETNLTGCAEDKLFYRARKYSER